VGAGDAFALFVQEGDERSQLHRTLGVTYKTAWFMAHRIREAMGKKPSGKLGGGGMIVEVDEPTSGFRVGREANEA
jgi:hypothetical protein